MKPINRTKIINFNISNMKEVVSVQELQMTFLVCKAKKERKKEKKENNNPPPKKKKLLVNLWKPNN